MTAPGERFPLLLCVALVGPAVVVAMLYALQGGSDAIVNPLIYAAMAAGLVEVVAVVTGLVFVLRERRYALLPNFMMLAVGALALAAATPALLAGFLMVLIALI